VYVTSTDDHDFHDITMIGYLLCTLPWTLGIISLSPPNARAVKLRKYFAGAFFGTLVPLIYYFIQHKIHRVPGGIHPQKTKCPPSTLVGLTDFGGAYTIYAFFEWSLVLLDAGFDAVSILDFDKFEFQVVERGLKEELGSVKDSRSLFYSHV
jgi:hypothetical protein